MDHLLKLTLVPAVNAAFQYNNLPIIREIRLENNSDQPLAPLELELSATPAVFSNHRMEIGAIAPKSSWYAGPIQLRIDLLKLIEHTESFPVTFKVSLFKDGVVLEEQHHSLQILAYDQWQGASVMPEMLASYVTPNHPKIQELLLRASTILGEWTGRPSLDGYQSRNPDRIRKQVAAVFQAVAELSVHYITAPASFETSGQRIRLSDQVIAQRIGNCLDMSVLFCSCLEAAGIHPLLVIIQGHAFAGAWLTEDSFADPVLDDISLLTKRVADGIHEIVLLESTLMNAGNTIDFEQAVRTTSEYLAQPERFLWFLDVHRARLAGIRPLPQRVPAGDGWSLVEDKPIRRHMDQPDSIQLTDALTTSKSTTRQDIWERKLLDLSLRNALVNMRLSKGLIQLMNTQLAEIEDLLSAGDDLQLLDRPAEYKEDISGNRIRPAVPLSDPLVPLLQEELKLKRLRTYSTASDTLTSLTHIYRNARQSLEENGANTLFLVLGALKWFETAQSEKPVYAPLLLLPVDMIRKTGHRGYALRSRDEDLVVNITLFELLRKDHDVKIDGLDELPRDGEGVDVRQILNHIRKAILSKPGWDVEDLLFLGQFSFSKFVMWNDIHSHAGLLSRNKIVRSLLDHKLSWEPVIQDQTHLDSIPVKDIMLPIMADGSQTAAIQAAASGQSFILHGPPGTGKSQTITNIIANALYQGKRVLFVAEKMAALEVVEKRLRDIGLDHFCLELHSNKSRKTAVLEQFKKLIEAQRKQSPPSFAMEAEKIHQLRTELQAYAHALHQQRRSGISIYEAINAYIRYAPAATSLHFPGEWLRSLDAIQWMDLQELIQEMEVAVNLIGYPAAHPLSGIGLHDYNPELRQQIAQLTSEAERALEQLEHISNNIFPLLHLNLIPESLAQFEWVKVLLKAVQQSPDLSPAFLTMDQPTRILPALRQLAEEGRKAGVIYQQLQQRFSGAWAELDAGRLRFEWTQHSSSWFLPRWLGHRRIRIQLQAFATTPIETAAIPELLEKIILWRQFTEQVAIAEHWLKPLLGADWKAPLSDWERLLSMADALTQILQASQHLIASLPEQAIWKQQLAHEWQNGSTAWVNWHATTFQEYASAVSAVSRLEAELALRLAPDQTDMVSKDWLEKRKQKWRLIATNLHTLKDWTYWRSVRERALKKGLQPAVELVEGAARSGSLSSVLLGQLYKGLIDAYISQEPVLARFNGQLFDEKVRRFIGLTERFQELTRTELYAVLSARIPNLTKQAAKSSEVSVLQRAIHNNGRGVSIRKLFELMPNLLEQLCPCMLMSPISVAQYLSLNLKPFDLVIFDEASQMPTSEAVGAMARGKELIVVGDPKQMPPTSFFSSQQFDEEFADKEDLESVLDDCLALSMPSKYLQWHYRSRHESLIAFSNARFYEHKLLTFPSVAETQSQVRWIPVNGYYDRGRTGVNHQEAEAIVADVLRRAGDATIRHQSIGIVTFNIKQQKLIQDLLDKAMMEDPRLESVLLQRDEPLFVKNLENVQGDERDVILFSIGFGKDKEGKMYMNFGPLNREGGWRRLNVAVSRARYEMNVFSTLRPEEIDLSRTSAEGAAGLKAFLEYAAKGKQALPVPPASRKQDQKEALIEAVAQVLLEKGYRVDQRLGTSDFRIDIAVLHPDENKYLLAVMCDGYGFASSATVRDRHMGRSGVLQQLGWNVYQIWSADWWEDAQAVLTKLDDTIRKAITGEKPILSESVIINEQPLEHSVLLPPTQADIFADHTLLNGERVYTRALVGLVSPKLTEEIYEPKHHSLIEKQMRMILDAEAPITRKQLYDHMAEVWRVNRFTGKLTDHFDQILSSIRLHRTPHFDDFVLWLPSLKPDQLKFFRIPGKEFKREGDRIPEQEIALAATELVKLNFGLLEEDLIRELAKLFGFARTGKTVEQAMQLGIRYAVQRQWICRQGEKYTLMP